ncbi:hypothetical protein FACS1894140_0400 [Spirochaetia bacterium]|nr:hypothetical protein FACS1894140_0400 [Spirochaetia bacterium]
MRKYFVLIFAILGIYVFGQNLLDIDYPANDFQEEFTVKEALSIYNNSLQVLTNDKIIKILLGEKSLLQYPLNIFSLANIDSKYYRLIRNMIFAQYGYIFKSQDLSRFFSKYEWYKPVNSNVDNFLTDVDRRNIERVQSFESMNINNRNIAWDNTRIGIWQDLPAMAAGWADRFVIYSDNRMEFYDSQMRQLGIRFGMTGTYLIKGNVLEFTVNKIIYRDFDLEIGVSGASGYSWENSPRNTITLEKPIVYKFPVTAIETKIMGHEFTRSVIKIGGSEFYKMRDDVNDKF